MCGLVNGTRPSIFKTLSTFTSILTLTEITLEEFTAEFETLQEEDREKEAVILAGQYPELYERYWVEVCGEELA
jgi:hypothetical protein